MISYSEIEIPSRVNHLWRYTPWNRVHPTSVEEVPDVDSIKFSEGTDSDSKPSDEIARAFLHELVERANVVSLSDGDEIDLDVRCSGHVCAGELQIQASGKSSIVVRISGEPGWAGLRIIGDISPNSQLSIAVINDLATDSRLLRADDWIVGRDSTLEFANLSSGGFHIKSDVRVDLTAQGSSFQAGIAVHGHGSRHDDQHIEITHSVGHTDSSLVMHAACGDSSHSIGTGLLTIAEGANDSDAGQLFRNLLLSENARAEAIPELEVLADEVKAAHGAASAPIDLEQIHYLSSRGLSPSEAEGIIVEGFLMDAFREIKNDRLIEILRTRLLVHLECLIKG